MLSIRRSRLDVTRTAWAALALVTIAEGIVNLVGCGFIVADRRAELPCIEWMDNRKA